MLVSINDLMDGSATAKAMDYSLHRWAALTRYFDNPALPIDNDFDEKQIRPWTKGRKNWLFAGTLLAGQRAAAIMSLIQTAKLNGHDPYAYLHDVLTRLPTQRARDIADLLPHRGGPQAHDDRIPSRRVLRAAEPIPLQPPRVDVDLDTT